MPDASLVRHVAATTGLPPAEAARVVADVVAFYAVPVESLVRRWHQALQADGKKNPDIFADIAQRLAARVVAAPTLSERQLRRIVYG